MTLKPKIVKHNVTAVKIPFDNGICWKVGDTNYEYGWAYSKATDGGMFDVLHAPEGTVLKGDIISMQDPSFRGHAISFQPHEYQVTRQQSLAWGRANWNRCCDERDDLFYSDVDFVTYKNPKTGRLRTDRVYGISIQNEINVLVYRKNGKWNTMGIPIELIVEKHFCNFDENGCRIPIK